MTVASELPKSAFAPEVWIGNGTSEPRFRAHACREFQILPTAKYSNRVY